MDDDESSASGAEADSEGDGERTLPSFDPPSRLTPGVICDGQPLDWAGTLDLEALCETLLGLPVSDAEEEVREALKKVSGEATDADTLAVLLRVFHQLRESACEGYDSWDLPVEYCRRLLAICDKHFMTGGDSARADDFPAGVVAALYAECGRTLFLAGKLSQARDKLQKALSVWAMLSERSEAEQRAVAACRASMARALRRLGQAGRAQDEYLQALQALADVPGECPEISGLVSEFCEVVTEVGEDASVSGALLELISELAEDKLGEGSEEHLTALQELADACTAIGKPALAAPVRVTLARMWRAWCDEEPSAEPQADAAEHAAAQALEAAAMASMQDREFEAAVASWSLALMFRELLGAEEEVIAAMKGSLEALQQAAEASGDGDGTADSTDGAQALGEKPEPREEVEEEAEESERIEEKADEKPENWDDDEKEVQAEPPRPQSMKPSLMQSGLRGLRPAWAPRRAPPTQDANASSAAKMGPEVDNDAWGDD